MLQKDTRLREVKAFLKFQANTQAHTYENWKAIFFLNLFSLLFFVILFYIFFFFTIFCSFLIFPPIRRLPFFNVQSLSQKSLRTTAGKWGGWGFFHALLAANKYSLLLFALSISRLIYCSLFFLFVFTSTQSSRILAIKKEKFGEMNTEKKKFNFLVDFSLPRRIPLFTVYPSRPFLLHHFFNVKFQTEIERERR